LQAGHVDDDIPEALQQAGFRGPLLPPLGAHPVVPELIARAIGNA
jgi:sirohydrochlorin ferrochelatase